jgi:adenylate cyclase
MTHEVERKFLLNRALNDVLREAGCARYLVIEQRYLSDCGDWTTRIRQTIVDGQVSHMLTLKRKVNGIRSIELETPIDPEFYAVMTSQCGPALRKIRHEVEHQGHLWEIDLFVDPVFDGLVIAEIELSDEDEQFVCPDWIGEEVTNDRQYKSAKLTRRLK